MAGWRNSHEAWTEVLSTTLRSGRKAVGGQGADVSSLPRRAPRPVLSVVPNGGSDAQPEGKRGPGGHGPAPTHLDAA